MTDVEASFEDFTASGRTGRRNAIYELPQGLGGPGPSESEAAASAVSGNEPGEDRELVRCHLLYHSWVGSGWECFSKLIQKNNVLGCHSKCDHKVELKV